MALATLLPPAGWSSTRELRRVGGVGRRGSNLCAGLLVLMDMPERHPVNGLVALSRHIEGLFRIYDREMEDSARRLLLGPCYKFVQF